MNVISAESFGTTVVRPPDFDSFWAETLATLADVPLNPTATWISERSTADVDVFDIRYDSFLGVRIAAWYCRPRGAVGRLPALIHVPGYVSEPMIPKASARMGYCALSVAPRGKLRSNSQFNPGYPGLLTENIIDRNTYGYRGFYVDAIRAVDFLLARDEVDPLRIGITGSSQGGALTLVAAAFRPEITCAAAGAPYLCGMIDAIGLTHSYPYQEINDYLRLNPERVEIVRDVLNYFDGINLASRISCPIIVNIGLNDDVCPPETGYAVFRAIGSLDKTLYPYEDCAHDAGRVWHDAISNQFLANHLRPGVSS